MSSENISVNKPQEVLPASGVEVQESVRTSVRVGEVIAHASVRSEHTNGDTQSSPLERESHLALGNALDTYASTRGERDLNWRGTNPYTVDPLQRKAHGYDLMLQNAALLQPVSKHPEKGGQQQSAMTICVPVHFKEDEEAVVQTLNCLQKAQKGLDQPVDVVLWANGTATNDTESLARERYEALRRAVEANDFTGMRISTAFQLMPAASLMTLVRANYMEAVAIDAVQKGYGFNHPIMWVDADTTFMSKDALSEINRKVREFDGLVVHANTQFSAEWARGVLPAEMDPATKAVVINELQRRQMLRTSHSTKNYEYIEESGFAIALGTYLRSGGFNADHPMSESGTLLKELKSTGIKNLVPTFFIEQREQQPQYVSHATKARLGTSGRRHYRLVQRDGAGALVGIDTHGYYGQEDRTNFLPVTSDNLKDVLSGIREAKYWIDSFKSDLPPPSLSVLSEGKKYTNKLVDRYFNDGQ